MISRSLFVAFSLAAALAPAAAGAAFGATPHRGAGAAAGRTGEWLEARNSDKKSSEKASEAKADSGKPGKPTQVGSFGDWGVFTAPGAKDKTCYALAVPKERAPASLKRDPAYVFISNRPGEKVRNEVSIIMGFSVKEGAEAKAEVGGSNFSLIAKGANAWIKNPAEEARFVEAMKKGAKLVVKVPSAKGNMTVDTYSLSGISQALDKVQKECP